MIKTQIEKEEEVRKTLIQAYHMLRLYDINKQLIIRVYNVSVKIRLLPIYIKYVGNRRQ